MQMEKPIYSGEKTDHRISLIFGSQPMELVGFSSQKESNKHLVVGSIVLVMPYRIQTSLLTMDSTPLLTEQF